MTKIEWCHYTFNPWWGCSKVSAGCKNCYAETLDARFKGNHWGDNAGRRFFGEKHWNQALRWNRKAKEDGVRRRVFVASMSDVFEIHPSPEENSKLDEARQRLWKLIGDTPHLDWLLLTKRPENWEQVPARWAVKLSRPRNVWFGATAENQEQADLRIPHLIKATWPAVRFVSYEPALEPIDISKYMWPTHKSWPAKYQTWQEAVAAGETVETRPQCLLSTHVRLVDWVIAGAESGPNARPMNEGWVREVRDRCQESHTPFFYKQRLVDGLKISIPHLDGVQHAEFPKRVGQR